MVIIYFFNSYSASRFKGQCVTEISHAFIPVPHTILRTYGYAKIVDPMLAELALKSSTFEKQFCNLEKYLLLP